VRLPRAQRKAAQIIASTRRVMRLSGIGERVAAVQAAMLTQAFVSGFAAGREGRIFANMEEVRTVALKVLAEMGIDTTDVLLTFAWKPLDVGGKLTPFVRAHTSAVEKANARIEAKRVEKLRRRRRGRQ